MKVIVASFAKTGTKSLNAALTKLGFSVYDFIENGVDLQNEWIKIYNEGWTTELFREMYENIDAVVDLPACYFWEEIHKAFPDAKIILTMRENEDVWYKSFEKQMLMGAENYTLRMLQCLSPTQIHLLRGSGYGTGLAVFGDRRIFDSKWFGRKMNEQLLKMKYRAHNAHVLQNAPKDKLFVYNIKDGWEPLCKFLDVAVPDEPFPRRNVGGTIFNEYLTTHPIVLKMQREAEISLMALISATILLSVCMYKKGVGTIGRILSTSFMHCLKMFKWR